jgi:hypothetical protein
MFENLKKENVEQQQLYPFVIEHFLVDNHRVIEVMQLLISHYLIPVVPIKIKEV